MVGMGKEAKEAFEKNITQKCVGLLDLVTLYPSLKFDLSFLIRKCDTIMPRYYTIASSTMVHPNKIRIAISMSSFQTHDGKERMGLVSKYCTDILKSNGKGMKPRIFVKESNFDMRADLPLLCVGPGTGVVPFIAFAEERQLLQSKGEKLTEAHLFFGCRDKDTDFIYRDFLAEMCDKKVFSHLGLAFSRAADKSPKVYVQDVLKQSTDVVKRLLVEEKGCLYLCGATKMGSDVQTLVK